MSLLERAKRARDLYAALSLEDPAYLPLYEAFERDVIELQARRIIPPQDRARQRVERLREMAELV